MSKLYISIPVDDIHIGLPVNLNDKYLKIQFTSEEAIDDAIAQLEILKQTIKEEGAAVLCGL